MTATPDEQADWIRPGAEVVVYRDQRGQLDTWPLVTTVRTVASKSFTVHGRDERFSLTDLATKRVGDTWHRLRYCVTRPDSATHRRLQAARLLREAELVAHDAVSTWQRNRADLTLIDTAIAALAVYRDALASGSDQP